jgi:two-component system LytT family response regulator
MHTALIVDDEPAQQELLSNMLRKNFPNYELKAICSDVNSGIEKINYYQPELVFLDVVMPPKTGFDLLSSYKQVPFEVIFTTSHEQFAINAFKVSAVDYLLKPFGAEELKTALQKFEQRIAAKQSMQHFETLLHNIHNNTSDKARIALPTLNGFVFVQASDILRCEGDNVYTIIWMADKTKHLISKTLKECEELLTQYNFFRIHQSHLINMRHINEYIKGDGGIVKMIDGAMLDVSRRKRDEFLMVLNKI